MEHPLWGFYDRYSTREKVKLITARSFQLNGDGMWSKQ